MKKFVSFLLIMLMITSSASASSQPSSWARDEVKTAISLGLVPKDLQNNYNAPITRIEFTQLIMQLVNTWTSKGLTEEITKRIPNLENNMFLDTDAESVRYLATLGIVEGDGKGFFMPKDLLQRQQAAKILYKTADRFTMVPAEDIMISTIYRGYSSHEMPHSFKDSWLLRNWSREYVNWTYRHGIMEGVNDNRFAPEESYTREQAILTALRLYYVNGTGQLSTIPPVDYYPIYKDIEMKVVTSWIDSTLRIHNLDDVNFTPDNEIQPPDEDESLCTIVTEESGGYGLYSAYDEKLSSTYEKPIIQIDKNHFLGWVSDNPKTY
ncbi:MAG: S-layer homology domain-containing protein, partial [Tissierellia bacterium]|nr:S-layer homology domain-containing protein [Tissierellia bacterium]